MKKVMIQSNFDNPDEDLETQKPEETKLAIQRKSSTGRPVKDASDRREHSIKIYCTKEEKNRIKKLHGASSDIRRKLLEDINE